MKIVLNSRKNEVPSDSSLIHFNLETEFQGQPSQKVFYLHLVILLKSGRAITEIGVRAMITRLLVYGHYFKVDNYERRIIHVSQTWARILGGNVLGEFVYATGKSCGVFGPFDVSPIDHYAGKNIANVSLPRVVI